MRSLLRSTLAAVLLSAAVGGAVLVQPLAPASATQSSAGSAATSGMTSRAALPTPQRIGGADRYEQSVLASQSLSIKHADIVYVASGEKFPDALSAASIAGLHDVPLLLTARDGLPDVVRREIARLTPMTIVIVGGEASVSETVASQLSRSVTGVTVTRVAGADRFAVSRSLILDRLVGAPDSTAIMLASGAQFTDALSAAAAATELHTPVLLVDGTETRPTSDESALFTARGTSVAIIVGGESSVSAALKTSLDATHTTHRLAGPDRFTTSVAVNAAVFESADIAYLASGVSFPDALSGAPAAAHYDAPLYLVRPDCVPSVVLDDLARLAPKSIVMLGGPATLGQGVADLVRCA
jgi:putative cell wall-binding protein